MKILVYKNVWSNINVLILIIVFLEIILILVSKSTLKQKIYRKSTIKRDTSTYGPQ